MSDAQSPQPHGHPSAGSSRSDETRGHRKTTSAILLHRAVQILGADAVAPVLGLTTAELARLEAVDRRMSFEQQRTLAAAILVLSDGHPELRRGAISLLAQLDAANEFVRGTTQRHSGPPPKNRW